jgi:tyrosinase
MSTYTRANAWNKGGTFDNPDLLWYAKGVGAMQARAISDPASWWFFAAIHGQYLQSASVPMYFANGWGAIPSPPTVPGLNSYQPPASTQYWDQCQHQTWFFAPWHRGYLLALEAQVRADVIKLGGPKTWALPYWDYFGAEEPSKPGEKQHPQYDIPPAFTQQKMPDGKTDNPLYVAARYGPDGSGKTIFVPTPAGNKAHGTNYPPVTRDCMSDTIYKGDDTTPEFGGPDTTSLGCFSHGGGTSGDLENNPHNLVHVFVGGPNMEGVMGDPGLAALDPIFYIHHANIDRMWAAWNQAWGNSNPTDANWLHGPAACGDAVFVMPMPGPASWVYTPQQVSSLSQTNYEYESYASVSKNVKTPAALLSERLTRLGKSPAAEGPGADVVASMGQNVELFGATEQPVPVTGAAVRTSVRLDPAVLGKVSANLVAASEAAPPDRVFLKLENVMGVQNAPALSVYVNLPDGANPSDHPELLAGSLGLFGLRPATVSDGRHGGRGLTFSLEITKIVDALHLGGDLDRDSLDVTVVSARPIPEQAPITIGRVSVYRKGR